MGRLEKAMKRRLGDPVRAAAGERALGRQVLDARDDGHGPQPRPQRPQREGTGPGHSDERFAYDSYRRFIALYARIVLRHRRRAVRRRARAGQVATLGSTSDAELPAEALKDLCSIYRKLVKSASGRAFPQDPQRQLRGAIEAVFRSWDGARARAYRDREKIPHDLGTAVNVQVMVFGNRDESSGTGVGFTRNAATGEDKPYGDFLVNAQGEDVVAGIRNTENLDDLGKHFPGVKDELIGIFARLEAHYRDMCDTEFTIEQGKLWMLQTRVGKRTGRAALRMAVDMTNQRRRGWKITRRRGAARASPRITSSRCCTPSSPRPTCRSSPPAWPPRRAPRSARRTSPPTTRPTRPPRAPRSSWSATRPRPRTSTACRPPQGILDLAGRAGQPRRRRRPRLGHPGRGGRREREDLGQGASPPAG